MTLTHTLKINIINVNNEIRLYYNIVQAIFLISKFIQNF